MFLIRRLQNNIFQVKIDHKITLSVLVIVVVQVLAVLIEAEMVLSRF